MTEEIDYAPLRVKGRATKDVTCTLVRPVEEQDLAFLNKERGVKPPQVKELRYRHHTLARLLAAGKTDIECSVDTGYSQSRISILKADPAFEELVKFYVKELDAEFVDLGEMLGGLSKTAAGQLLDELEEDPDAFTKREKMDLLKIGADRTGHGPQVQSTHQVNIHVDMAERMERARQRLRSPEGAAAHDQVIEVELKEDG